MDEERENCPGGLEAGILAGLEMAPELKETAEFILNVFPRGQCRTYTLSKGKNPVLLIKEEFDRLCRKKEFSDGPNVDNMGTGYGEPYNPDRQCFGELKDGRVVYCELNPDRDREFLGYLKSKK